MRFILVDEIRELEPGKSVTAVKTLHADEDVFLDHFPGFPVVPGVLLTEMMGQAAGKCLNAEGTHDGQAILAKIHSASFRDWVRPEEEIVLRATIVQNRSGYARAECSADVRGKNVSSADLFFIFVPDDQFAPGYRDEILDRFMAARSRPPGGESPE